MAATAGAATVVAVAAVAAVAAVTAGPVVDRQVLVAATAGEATAVAATAEAATVVALTAVAATAATMIGRVMATIFWATEALKHLGPKEKGLLARARGKSQKFIGFVRKTSQYACLRTIGSEIMSS